MSLKEVTKELSELFYNKDRLEEGPMGDRTNYVDEAIRAENRLRRLVGAPIVARKNY